MNYRSRNSYITCEQNDSYRYGQIVESVRQEVCLIILVGLILRLLYMETALINSRSSI